MQIITKLENVRYEIFQNLQKISETELEYHQLLRRLDELNKSLMNAYEESLVNSPEIFMINYEIFKENYQEVTYIESIFMQYGDLLNYRIYLKMTEALMKNPQYLTDVRMLNRRFERIQMGKVYSELYKESINYLHPNNSNKFKYSLAFLDDDITDILLRNKDYKHHLEIDEILAMDHLCSIDYRSIIKVIDQLFDTDKKNIYQILGSLLFNQIRDETTKLLTKEVLDLKIKLEPRPKSKIVSFEAYKRRK